MEIIVVSINPVAPSGALGIRKTPFHFSFLILQAVGTTPWTADQPVWRPLPTQDNLRRHCHVVSDIKGGT